MNEMPCPRCNSTNTKPDTRPQSEDEWVWHCYNCGETWDVWAE